MHMMIFLQAFLCLCLSLNQKNNKDLVTDLCKKSLTPNYQVSPLLFLALEASGFFFFLCLYVYIDIYVYIFLCTYKICSLCGEKC